MSLSLSLYPFLSLAVSMPVSLRLSFFLFLCVCNSLTVSFWQVCQFLVRLYDCMYVYKYVGLLVTMSSYLYKCTLSSCNLTTHLSGMTNTHIFNCTYALLPYVCQCFYLSAVSTYLSMFLPNPKRYKLAQLVRAQDC